MSVKLENLLTLLFIFIGAIASAQIKDYSIFDKKLNFYIANDLGRDGYCDQKPITELVGTMDEEIDPEFVLAPGGIRHLEGVRNVDDPLWMTNFELICNRPELMIDWYPVLGDHEYRGNTQAVLDYSRVDHRWVMPARYHTKTFEEKGTTIRIVWTDAAPLIDKYRNETETYPDACRQDMNGQLAWLDPVLTTAKKDWVIVTGHHPIYVEIPKDQSERDDLQKQLDPILRKHKVDMCICGHIHNFQHTRIPGSDVDYIVNSTGSLARKVKPVGGTQFCSPEPGFSMCSAGKKELNLRIIDKKRSILYTMTRKK